MHTTLCWLTVLSWGQILVAPNDGSKLTDPPPRAVVGGALSAEAAGQPVVPAPPREAAAPSVTRSSSATETRAAPLTPVGLTAAELMASALAARPRETVTGRPLGLAAALAPLAERRHQGEAAHLYWRLVQALCRQHFGADFLDDVGQLKARPEEQLLLDTVQAAAKASLREAELAVLQAQHDLAALLNWPPESPLPLPADVPHVGVYRTSFQEMFASRPAPAQARLIDQTLPLQQKAIEIHKSAVEAAQEAVAGSQREYAAGKADLKHVLTCLGELRRQLDAFVAAVCRYNDDIAEYAVLAISPYPSGPSLASMLISVARETNEAVVPESATGAALVAPRLPAAAGRPTPAVSPYNRGRAAASASPMVVPAPSSASGVMVSPPSPIPTPGAGTVGGGSVPTARGRQPAAGTSPGAPVVEKSRNAATQRSGAVPTSSEPSNVPKFITPPVPQLRSNGTLQSPIRPIPSQGAGTAVPNGLLPAPLGPWSNQRLPGPAVSDPFVVPAASYPGADQVAPSGDGRKEVPVIEVAPSGSQTRMPPSGSAQSIDEGPSVRVAQRLAVPDQSGSKPASWITYPGLREASPQIQVSQLIVALCGERGLPSNLGKPIALEDCLRERSADQRTSICSNYWTARQRMAEYQAWREQLVQLQALASLLVKKSQAADASLHAMTLAAEASLLDAHTVLLESLSELAERLGRTRSEPWPVPNAFPQYEPSATARASSEIVSRGALRRAAELALLGKSLEEHATAVAQSDAARAAQFLAVEKGQGSVPAALSAVALQGELTRAFLSPLMAYQLGHCSGVASPVPVGR